MYHLFQIAYVRSDMVIGRFCMLCDQTLGYNIYHVRSHFRPLLCYTHLFQVTCAGNVIRIDGISIFCAQMFGCIKWFIRSHFQLLLWSVSAQNNHNFIYLKLHPPQHHLNMQTFVASVCLFHFIQLVMQQPKFLVSESFTCV